MNFCLLFDTSSDIGIIGIGNAEGVICETTFPAGMFHSKNLVLELDRMLEVAHCKKEQLSHIAVGHGPGSYTGMRVAASFAKGISLGLQIPIMGISSLALYVPENGFEGTFAAVLDAHSGGLYILCGEKRGATISFHGKPQRYSVEQSIELFSHIQAIITPHDSFKDKFLSLPEVQVKAPTLSHFWKLCQGSLEEGSIGNLSLFYLKN